MPKVPSMSRELARLLGKGGAILPGRGLQTMQFIQGLLKAEDTLLPFKWERKVSILYTANGF